MPRPTRPNARAVARQLATLAVVATLIVACSGPTTDPPPDTTLPGGVISGTIQTADETAIPRSATEGGVPLAARADDETWSAATADSYGAPFVPGEVIVAFEPGRVAATSLRLTASNATLRAVRSLPLPGAHLYRATGADTLAMVRELATRPDVRYAQPNYVLHPMQTVEPNDALWVSDRSLLWHYDALELPEAWAITTGSSSVVVAVVDTGILVDLDAPSSSVSHPDLYAKTLPGYDFISDVFSAGDGDGRDDDPYDVGDTAGGQPSFHGTHVAGTVGARSNDAFGVPGVSWGAMILPIRVLGRDGGTMVDIVDGSLWAAGLPVAGVPTNPNPAHVLNLSLGGEAPCSPYAQDAFDRIASASPNAAVVVVAAGNENADASDYTPAGCRNVIAVGASDYGDDRAPYSNYGTRIDVMAPGGDLTVDLNDDGTFDGVLSTWGLAPTGGDPTMTWGQQQGTSMAAPHVAGIVALMKTIDPDLTLTETQQYLTSTAIPWTSSQCGRALATDCGAGRVDAPAVLTAVTNGTLPTPSGEPLAFVPDPLDFGSDLTQATVTMTNTSDVAIDWAAVYTEDPQNPAPLEPGWLVGQASGTLAAGDAVDLTLYVDRSFVGADGAFYAHLEFDELDAVGGIVTTSRLGLRIVKETESFEPAGRMSVYAYVADDGEPSGWRLDGAYESSTPFTSFSLDVGVGDHLLVGWADENRNGAVDEGDLTGTYPSLIGVADGAHVGGIELRLAPYTSLSDEAPSTPLDAWLRGAEQHDRGGREAARP